MKFLVHDATTEELRAACIHNHLVWMRRLAEAGGGSIFSEDGLEWAATWQPGREVTVAVTKLPDSSLRRRIDEIGEYCRANHIETLSYWALDEAYANPLDIWLCARGLRPGGRPHWMAVDIDTLPEQWAPSTEYEMTMPESFDDHTVPELLPYHPASKQIREALVRRRPQHVWQVVWWRDDAPVGCVALNFTDGELGVAGIHDLFFLPSSRVPGLGFERFDELTDFARKLGCRYGIANAVDEAAPLYRVMGFRSLGFGRTWWRPRHAALRAPDEREVALAEAVGEGDIGALASVAGDMDPEALDKPLANGMIPLRLAAHHDRPEVARWLLDRGATPDLIAAWELGWKEEARQLLERDPAIATQRRPYTGKTLLHVAVERDDPGLARLLLECGADPQTRDARYDGTPLDWAREFRRRRVAGVLQAHERARR